MRQDAYCSAVQLMYIRGPGWVQDLVTNTPAAGAAAAELGVDHGCYNPGAPIPSSSQPSQSVSQDPLSGAAVSLTTKAIALCICTSP